MDLSSRTITVDDLLLTLPKVTVPEPPPTGLRKARKRVEEIVEHPAFQWTVVVLILLNAVILGCQTSAAIQAAAGDALDIVDRVLLAVFTVELALRAFAMGWGFFRDPWCLFDLVIISVSWVPAGDTLSVLRALRTLRVLRLISVLQSLRNVVEAMLAAVPGMASISLLLFLMFYVFGVMAVPLFGETQPMYFGTLGDSLFTLFQIMTLENWSEIVREAMSQHWYALPFFLPFIIISTFVILNLFIGVIVDSIQNMHEQRAAADPKMRAAEARKRAEADNTRKLLEEIRALRAGNALGKEGDVETLSPSPGPGAESGLAPAPSSRRASS
ncbi:ion transport protein [Hyaloraphidium curvatum]|nr:ion transport protein [Hyaloraphidium curvatum]